MLTYCTIKSIKNKDITNNSLSLSSKDNKVYLLGNIPHNSEIIVTHELIDFLQKALNLKEELK